MTERQKAFKEAADHLREQARAILETDAPICVFQTLLLRADEIERMT